MDENPVIYCKQPGETLVPVTVRLKWLPDGTLQPLHYWLPDDSCHEVTHIYDMTPLKYLRDGGAGVRFKAKTAIGDTYLYLADNKFYGKNFIDNRYGHERKEYVPVVLDIFPNGNYELVCFWVDELRYNIEKTIDISKRGTFTVGGLGLHHKVKIRLVNEYDDDCPDPDNILRREAALYFEINKWFVEKNI